MDNAIILHLRPHGESAAVLRLLTRQRGRFAGYVHGARSRGALRGVLDLGNIVQARWQSRAEDQLGSFTVEMEQAIGPFLFDDPRKLLCVQSMCAILDAVLPEREPHPALFDGTAAFLQAFDGAHWPAAYVVWEMALLAELGFGLDLSQCAVTGAQEGLEYVSPKSGRAVCGAAAGEYKDRLLALPDFLKGGDNDDGGEILKGLQMTGHFLRHRVFDAVNQDLPAPRHVFEGRFRPASD